MSTDLNIQLTPQAFVGLQQAATASGRTPAEEAAAALEQAYKASSNKHAGDSSELRNVRKIEDHFGSVDTGEPIGLDNDQIDAELSRVYGNLGDAD